MNGGQKVKKDYVILNIEQEYPGFTGTEKWMIITDLSEEEFASVHPEQYPCWKEAVIISTTMGVEIARYRCNERKHGWRSRMKETPIEDETLFIEDEKVSEEFSNLWLRSALDTLTPQQRARVTEHYVLGFSEKAIAKHEGVNQSTIHRSIKKAVRNLQKYCDVHREEMPNA